MFDNIRKVRSNWHLGMPLWKLNLTEVEFDQLSNILIRNYDHPSYSREAALYYSEWWRRFYNGGIPNNEKIAEKLSKNVNPHHFFRNAKKGLKELHVTILTGFRNELPFRTLLAQGGLPLGILEITDRNGHNTFEKYLQHIITHVKKYNTSWDSIEYIENNFSYLLPRSFRNEHIYEFTRQIVGAIVYNDENLFPFDLTNERISTIVKNLQRINPQNVQRSNTPIKILWEIVRNNNSIQLFYSIELNKVLDEDWLTNNRIQLNQTFNFRLNVNGKMVAKYVRRNNGNYGLDLQLSTREAVEIGKYSNLSLQFYTREKEVIDFSIPNSSTPDFDDPIVLIEKGERYQVVKKPNENSSNFLIFHKANWNIQNSDTSLELESVYFNGKEYGWISFENQLVLTNNIGQTLSYKPLSNQQFLVYFGNWMVDWIQNSNYNILFENPNIRIINEDGDYIISNRIKIWYRLKKQTKQWTPYSFRNSRLPIGLIEFMLTVDDANPFFETFYFADDLSFKTSDETSNEGSILWHFDGGRVMCLNSDQYTVENLGLNAFRLKAINICDSYSATCKFELVSIQDNKSSLRLEIATPFQGITLIDPCGRKVLHNDIICIDSLYGYRIAVTGFADKKINLRFKNNEINAVKQVVLKKGIDNKLINIRDEINELNHLFVKSHLKQDSELILEIDYGYRINIKKYNTFVYYQASSSTIKLRDVFENFLTNFDSTLYAIPVDVFNFEQVEAIQLKSNDQNDFLIDNELNPHGFTKFIIFNNLTENSNFKVRPTFYSTTFPVIHSKIIEHLLTGEETPKDKIALEEAEEKKRLEMASIGSDYWNVTIQYFICAQDNGLPFESFRCFNLISQSQELMARFAVYLCSDNIQYSKEKKISGLKRFEEEFAIAWHWITPSIWLNSINEYCSIFKLEDSFGSFTSFYTRYLTTLLYNTDDFSIDPFKKYLIQDEKICQKSPLPFNSEIQELFAVNNDIPDYISKWYPIINNNYLHLYPIAEQNRKRWGALLSPLTSALAVTDLDKSIFSYEYHHRQIVLNYRRRMPYWYHHLYTIMIERIKLISNN